MSLTYVLTTLFRGDDIEQVEYVICQMQKLSSQPRQILVFNGGYHPRNQKWLEKKYPGVRVIELDVPTDWSIGCEFHYYRYVCTQHHKYIETEFYLKADRDIFIYKKDFDKFFIEFMRERPDVGATGYSCYLKRKSGLDRYNFFQGLPQPVSYARSLFLNGGIEIFRTSSMSKIASILEENAKRIWQETLAIGEDDLISLILQGTGDQIEHCPLVKVLAKYSKKEYAKSHSALQYDDNTLSKILSILSYPDFCIAHGFKPFVYFRPLYEFQHRRLGIIKTIEKREQSNEKDLYLLDEYDPNAEVRERQKIC